MSDMISDIGDAILQLRNAFEKHHLPVPTVIEVPREVGVRLRQEKNANVYLSFDFADLEKTFLDAHFAGVIIRWEARRVSRPQGGFYYD